MQRFFAFHSPLRVSEYVMPRVYEKPPHFGSYFWVIVCAYLGSLISGYCSTSGRFFFRRYYPVRKNRLINIYVQLFSGSRYFLLLLVNIIYGLIFYLQQLDLLHAGNRYFFSAFPPVLQCILAFSTLRFTYFLRVPKYFAHLVDRFRGSQFLWVIWILDKQRQPCNVDSASDLCSCLCPDMRNGTF